MVTARGSGLAHWQGGSASWAPTYEYPCIRTEPIIPCPEMEAALNRLGDYASGSDQPAGVEASGACWSAKEKMRGHSVE